LVLDSGEIRKVGMNDFPDLLFSPLGLAEGTAHNGEHALNIRIEQALSQNTLPHHPRRAK